MLGVAGWEQVKHNVEAIGSESWRLSSYYFVYFAFLGIFSPYFSLFLAARGFSMWEIGLLLSQMQLMRLLGPNVWGYLVDHYGQRVGFRLTIIRLAAWVSLAGFTLFFFLRDFYALLLAITLVAFFWSAALPLVESITFDVLKEQPERYSRIRQWGSWGFIFAVQGLGLLLDYYSQHSASLILWAMCLSLVAIIFCARRLPAGEKVAAPQSALSLKPIVKQRPVWTLLVACLAMAAAHGAYYAFYSLHLQNFGYGKGFIGAMWSLGVLAEIAVFLTLTLLCRYYSFAQILCLTLVAAVLRFLLIAWLADSMVLMIFAQLMHGLTFGAYHAAAISLINHWFTEGTQARGQALYSSLSFGAGGLLGTFVAGWTWSSWGGGWSFSVSALFAAVGAIFCGYGLLGGGDGASANKRATY